MTIDLTTPQAQIAKHFMKRKGLDVDPWDVEQLEDEPCWYFYYDLPEGGLELEVFFDERTNDWDVTVTSFPVDL